MPPRKAAKAYQGPPLFLSLAWETRARIYQYYFPGARVRFTRPTDGSKARVYYKSKIDLMLICCTVYLGSPTENTPLALLRTCSYNTAASDILSFPASSPQKRWDTTPSKRALALQVHRVRGTGGWHDTVFQRRGPPSSADVEISILAAARGFLPTPLPQTADELKRFVDGSLDDGLKENAKSATLTFRILPLPHQYPPYYGPMNKSPFGANVIHPVEGSNWLWSIILDSKRKFQVIDRLTVHFRLFGHLMYWSTELRLQYDVDTLETVERIVFHHEHHSMEVWEDDGLINKYTLRKDKTPGKLVDTRMATAK